MAVTKRAKSLEALTPSETTIQTQAVYIFRLQYPRLERRLLHIPNEGKRTRREGAKLKKMGLVPGASDLILLVPKGNYGALIIEVKKKGGRVSEKQSDFLKDLEGDYKTVICWSVDEITREIAAYLGDTGRRPFNPVTSKTK